MMYPKYILKISNSGEYLLTGKKKNMGKASSYLITLDKNNFD